MSTNTASKKSPKAKLDAGAEAIRKAKAAEQKAAKKAAKSKTNGNGSGDALGLEVVKPSEESVSVLMDRCINLADDFSALTFRDETSFEEYLPIFDDFASKGARFQFVLGDLFNEGVRLFGDGYAIKMAKSGRPVSTLKKWGSISAHVDPAVRVLHPNMSWSLVAMTAKLDVQTQRSVLEDAASKFERGESVSVKEISATVHKLKPKKKPAKKKKKPEPEPYEMNAHEEGLYSEALMKIRNVTAFVSENKKTLKSLLGKLTGTDRKAIKEELDAVAELAAIVAD